MKVIGISGVDRVRGRRHRGGHQRAREPGYDLLVRAREEPWGQILTCFLAPGGLMVGIVRNPRRGRPGSDAVQAQVAASPLGRLGRGREPSPVSFITGGRLVGLSRQ
jgi:hypothetical protein